MERSHHGRAWLAKIKAVLIVRYWQIKRDWKWLAGLTRGSLVAEIGSVGGLDSG
jgi:hypothetical protein